jgi:2-polyprenyl-3-methyl-5-hydroxy-6-metoxy-1,4-benzoquinol methylase
MSARPRARVETLESRARASLGSSHDAIHRMVAGALAARGARGRLVDVGCGGGALWGATRARFDRYCGLDAVRYDGLPADAEFRQVDLDSFEWPVADGEADAVTAVETIEHLENPWAFVRALARLVKPGGWIAITTPNQLSVLSLLTLVTRRRFSAFQDAQYPAHCTALLESDLERMAAAAGLEDIEVKYTHHGRVPLTATHYPETLAQMFPRALSDNLMLIARRPRG